MSCADLYKCIDGGVARCNGLLQLIQQALRTDAFCVNLARLLTGGLAEQYVVVHGGVSILLERAALLQLLHVVVDARAFALQKAFDSIRKRRVSQPVCTGSFDG